MKANLLGIAVLGMLVLGLQVQALGEEDDASCPAAGSRLFYVFSPTDEVHVQRALALLDWVACAGEPMRLVGVLRLDPGDAATATAALDQLQPRLAYPIAASTQLAHAGIPAGLLAAIPPDTDYALLLTGSGAVAWAVPGEQLPSRLQAAAISTDIDESTWGKIKELFQ